MASELDLDAIEARRESTLNLGSGGREMVETDVPALVARVRELEAAVERVRAVEVADRVDHSEHVAEDGGPCEADVTWKSRMGRDIARALEGATDDHE